MLERNVPLAGPRVPEPGVALAERAAHRVLAAQPDRCPLAQERAEGQELGVRPVDALLIALESSRALVQLLRELGMDLESLGNQGHAGVEIPKLLDRHGRLRLAKLLGRQRLW